jgi:hypothetical protein
MWFGNRAIAGEEADYLLGAELSRSPRLLLRRRRRFAPQQQ